MSDRIDIAVVGCGISGLGAAWAASRDPRVHVTLYESRSKLGGHANTVMVSVCPARAPRAGWAARGEAPSLPPARRECGRAHGRSAAQVATDLPRRPLPPQVNGRPIDTGFLVYNENTYPNLIGLFEVSRGGAMLSKR